MMNFLRYCLSLLWVLFAGSLFVPSATWGYDAQTRQGIGYDGVSFSACNYDTAIILAANEEANGFVGTGGVFANLAEFLAAKTPLTSAVGDLRAAGLKDAHHVIQDAAVRDLPGYNTQLAPGVQLSGPSTAVGSPHYIATQVQRQAGGGTLAAEMRIGYKALRQAGYSETQARQIIGEADAYFRSIGATPSTPTRIPGNR